MAIFLKVFVIIRAYSIGIILTYEAMEQLNIKISDLKQSLETKTKEKEKLEKEKKELEEEVNNLKKQLEESRKYLGTKAKLAVIQDRVVRQYSCPYLS